MVSLRRALLYFEDQETVAEPEPGASDWHEVRTSPLFTSAVMEHHSTHLSIETGMYPCPTLTEVTPGNTREATRSPFVSFGGIGRVISEHHSGSHTQPDHGLLYMNTNAPSSTVICGVQGSGKSHSVSVIIENSLISLPELGKLPHSLSAVVFHLGAAQGGMHLPCESAFLGRLMSTYETSRVPVKVLVSPSNLTNMRKSYGSTGAEVVPFYLSTKDLNCSRMLSLMHVSEGDEIPLYMQVVQQILRSMGNNEFDYSAFKRALQDKQKTEFTQGQNMPLTLRIQLLEAMLLECQNRKQVRGLVSVKAHFEPGTITIVDLTDPFINPSSASALFDIALSLYLETEIPSGKLLVLDEAHKVIPIVLC